MTPWNSESLLLKIEISKVIFVFFFNSYDPEDDRWTIVRSMNHKRIGLGCAVVNRLLYAVGGFDGHERLTSGECYHPENNEWTMIKPMKCARSGAGVAAIGQYIFVVGGFDGKQQLSSVERYDTEKQEWTFVAPIKLARSALSLTALDGKLYAMGGFDGTSIVTMVEVYDPNLDNWLEGVPLTSGRSGHAAAVIYQPSTISDTHELMGQDSGATRDGGGGSSCYPAQSKGSCRDPCSSGTGIGGRSGMFGGGGGSRDACIEVKTLPCFRPGAKHCQRECKITKQILQLKKRFKSYQFNRTSSRKKLIDVEIPTKSCKGQRKCTGSENSTCTVQVNLKKAFTHLFIS